MSDSEPSAAADEEQADRGGKTELAPFIDISAEPNPIQPNEDSKQLDKAENIRSDSNYIYDYRIDYQLFQWIFILFFTFVSVIDRFTLNLWPLWVDSPGPTVPGNVGVSVFALIAWTSSRIMLVSSSYIFLFQCRVFWNWICERNIPNKYLKISDIHQTNITLHYHIGWALLGIPVVLHVWAIVFAAAFPQNDVKLYQTWMRPKNEDGSSIPFYADNLLSLGINDVYRIVSTSLTFFVLIPYSIVHICRNRNWSRAQWIHFMGAMIYTVDLIRMKSHPHCWVFNLPFILWWMIDRAYGVFCYRRSVAKLLNRVVLDGKYAILYLSVPSEIHSLRAIGDVFYVNFLEPKWDRAHPFTVFWNHKSKNPMIMEDEELEYDWDGHKFRTYRSVRNKQGRDQSEYVISRQSTLKNDDLHVPLTPVHAPQTPDMHAAAGQTQLQMNASIQSNDIQSHAHAQLDDVYRWDVAVIMQMFPNRTGCDPRKTWTSEAVRQPLRQILGLRTWGPYRSEYRILLRNETQTQYPATPLVLIGTGCGSSYLVDFYQYISAHNFELDHQIYIYFSTRSMAMFQWFTDITCHKHIRNLSVNAHLTSHDNVRCKEKKLNDTNRSRKSGIGRLDLEQIFQETGAKSNVFYCGSPQVQNIVHALCKKYKLTFHAGHSFY